MKTIPLPRLALAALPLILPIFALGGCSSPKGEAPTSIASGQQVDNMVAARKIFDESDKNWETLPQDKKDQFTKLVGGKSEDATRWWNKMLNPEMGAGTKSPGPGPNGPG